MNRRLRIAVAALILVITLQADALAAAAGRTTTAPPVVPVHVLWLHVDPLAPRSLYAGGVLFCADPTQSCFPWLMHSTDGGTSWSDLSVGLAATVGRAVVAPLIVAADGQHLYHVTSYSGGSPASNANYVAQSADAGMHWAAIGDLNPAQYGGGFRRVVLSPVSAQRLYAHDSPEPGGWQTSGDAGRTWGPCKDVATGLAHGATGLVADPTHVDMVYAVSDQGNVLRSDDACAHWTTPRPAPARDFTLLFDPHEGTSLVGQTRASGTPADRRYLSDDGGRTWRTALCPGALNGACPTFSVDNVFGAGAAYGFVNDGVYRFVGGGPAQSRLAVSNRVPARTSDILAVGGGARAGDPLYLLRTGVAGNVHGVLFRSLDAGRSWTQLSVGALPNLTPPSTAPGGLFVAQTGHTVAEPFLARYRATNPYILGQPLTEAFMEGSALTQVFEHTILALHGSQVVFDQLPQARGLCRVSIAAVKPDMRQFWQRNGGSAVFGAPLADCSQTGAGDDTEVHQTNGDGSGRAYAMQWFEQARLERHPEIANPRFRILLSLAGHDALKDLGWTP